MVSAIVFQANLLKIAYRFSCVICVIVWSQSAKAEAPAELVKRLQQTSALSIDAVIEAQFPNTVSARGFSVADPYSAQAAETVSRWLQAPGHENEVCALRFSANNQTVYELLKFDSATAAKTAGFTVTHQGRCGSCSTLRDLAAYLATPDLTTPARQCARRFGLARKKQCFEEQVGFTANCAESWAYNARHTKKVCLGTCVADYGLLNLLFHRYGGENVNESGELRPCLRCDEDKSGPGFKYSAGRTRRNSGITSAIGRPELEMYPVDHSAYFNPVVRQ